MTKTKSSEKNNSRKYSEKVTSNFEMIKKSIPKENQGEKFRKMYDKEDNFYQSFILVIYTKRSPRKKYSNIFMKFEE